MSNPDSSSWVADGWKVAQIIGGAFMGVLAWLGNRLTTRLESLERTTVTRDELKDAFATMRADRQMMHVENQQALRRIEDKLDATEPGVIASRLGRAERDIEDLRNWKQQVDPFIARRGEP